MTALYALASVVVVSLASLVGVLGLSWSPDRIRRVARSLVAFAVGALLGDAFIHLLPAAYARGRPGVVSAWVLGGVAVFFVVEKLLRSARIKVRGIAPAVGVNLFGDGLHNLIDGMLIGASYLASPVLGLSTTLAVLLHELPQELGDFGILVHGGLSPGHAVLWNLLSASAAIAGTTIALLVGTQVASFGVALLPLTAGGFVYIACADLIPDLHAASTSPRAATTQLLWMCAGAGVMFALLAVE
ncbi:MAG: ZIP family metal transporter [Myxococcaceae bacterium]|nr:ZIP family metal transporter [Myxococcaceae bacterium]